jgi:hypothetical protein
VELSSPEEYDTVKKEKRATSKTQSPVKLERGSSKNTGLQLYAGSETLPT